MNWVLPTNLMRRLTVLLLVLLPFFFPEKATAQLAINLVAVNASEETKTVAVKYYLPKELTPEDILDMGPLTLDYDVDKGVYIVRGDIEFKPKESKTFKIMVKDVWMITEEEISILKTQLDENVELMKGSDKYEAAQILKDKMAQQLDFILSQQTKYSDNTERRIEEYRAYVELLEDIRSKTFSLDYLEHEAPTILEMDETKTVKFILEVKSPSDKEEKTVKHKHYLPKEIRAEHIVDAQGFDIRYDNDKHKSFLEKEETFKPGESKKYEIVIRDIWNLPISKIEALEARALSAHTEISESAFAKSGQYLFERVRVKVDEIRSSIKEGQPIKDYIGAYRVNEKRYTAAEKDVQKLEQMLAIVRAKKLEELEKGKVKNILQKLQALRGLAALSEAIFKKGISVTTTWRIIMGTIIFLLVFTSWHFFVWLQRSKTMGEEQGLKAGETIKEVPKPGTEEKEDK